MASILPILLTIASNFPFNHALEAFARKNRATRESDSDSSNSHSTTKNSHKVLLGLLTLCVVGGVIITLKVCFHVYFIYDTRKWRIGKFFKLLGCYDTVNVYEDEGTSANLPQISELPPPVNASQQQPGFTTNAERDTSRQREHQNAGTVLTCHHTNVLGIASGSYENLDGRYDSVTEGYENWAGGNYESVTDGLENINRHRYENLDYAYDDIMHGYDSLNGAYESVTDTETVATDPCQELFHGYSSVNEDFPDWNRDDYPRLEGNETSSSPNDSSYNSVTVMDETNYETEPPDYSEFLPPAYEDVIKMIENHQRSTVEK